jgi:hypothetical protein
MKKYVFIVFVFPFLIFTCKTQHRMIEQPVKEISKVDNIDVPNALPYTIDSVFVKGDLLHIIVSYKAQKAADFDLKWNGLWLKSFPPKTSMVLVPTNFAEGKKEFKQTCIFDLENLKSSRPFYLQIKGYANSIFLDKED